MSQYPDPHSVPPPSIAAPAAYAPMPIRPQVVHIVAKPGGFWRAMGIVVGLFLFAAVFIIGLFFGIVGTIAGSGQEGVVLHETYRSGSGSTVAIIPIEGIINGRQASFVRAAVDDILNDRGVRSVILRVNSPGGEVTASDEIWYEVNRLKAKGLPVIASYGGVAASGGYYVSCGADYIMAQETCITGSIGVIAQILTFEGLMDKVGVHPVTLVATGSPEKSVANDVFRAWNEADKTKVRIMLDSAYSAFSKRVQDGRKAVLTNEAMVSAVANGSIYTAQQAKDNGLIDAIGYLDDAIAYAETKAGMATSTGHVIIIRQPPTLMGAIMGAEASARENQTLKFDADSIRTIATDLASPRMMYLLH